MTARLVLLILVLCLGPSACRGRGAGLRDRLFTGELTFKEAYLTLLRDGYLTDVPRDPGYTPTILNHYLATELSESGFWCFAHGPVECFRL